ncbi:MAG: type III pantothenate kinase [Planctomycetota bacterium]
MIDRAVIDVGNSSSTVGLMHGLKVLETHRFLRLDPETPGAIRSLLVAQLPPGVEVRIAGVHPQAVAALIEALGSQFPVLVAPTDFAPPIRNRCIPREAVGLDRLFGAAAAARDGVPVVIVDAGTAITVDWVGPEGDFEGGAIAAGVGLSFRALHTQTGQLPLVRAREPDSGPAEIPARATRTDDAIRSGVIRGLAGLVDRLVAEVSGREENRVVLTGGDGLTLLPYLRCGARFDPDLLLRGIALP